MGRGIFNCLCLGCSCRLKSRLARTRRTAFNMEDNMYKVNPVASYLIQKANAPRGGTKDLTPLKLQKILYYAQGWHLRECDQPLFDSKILAWKYGPVVKDIYDYYRGRPVAHITSPHLAGDDLEELDADTKKLLDKVWRQYGKRTAWELVGMTHLTQPWIDAFKDPVDDEIDNDDIRDYFLTLEALGNS
jgi:uncharacterized phage-associated protein